MKKVAIHLLSFYFIIGSLFPKSDFSQINRFVSLYDHYQDHLQTAHICDQKISFYQFIWMHFFDIGEHSDKDPAHENLPLQTINSSSAISSSYDIFILQLNGISASLSQFKFHAPLSTDFIQNIFQPPVQL
jgi:hypothetical protein